MSDGTLDLFGGPGGWGRHLGIENDPDVVATREAAGLPTIDADVSRTNPEAVGAVTGIVASAPCPPFSVSGNGEGRKDIELVLEALEDLSEGSDSRRDIRRRSQDPRSVLSVEPLRWVLALKPEWTAWEQVVGARPIWEHAATILTEHGYNVWVGYLDAYDYGVPQTRKRAILMAHRTKLVSRPPVRARVSMGDVLAGPEPDAILRMGRSRGTARTLGQPAPTIMFGKSPSGVAWYRPDGSKIRELSLQEALVLQGFPADYPVQGGKVSQFRQVGNAVPRGLADAIIERLES